MWSRPQKECINMATITAKSTRRTVSIDKLTVNFKLNWREHDNYDVPGMKAEILEMGRILTPLIVMEDEDGTLTVLRGNRRTLAGQELFHDPKTSVEVKEALSKVEILVYKKKDLTPEQIDDIIIADTQKSLNRTELLLAVWRLYYGMMPEKAIAIKLLYPLAKYSGNEKKLVEIDAIKDVRQRETAISKWFRGTLAGYMLALTKFPDYVKEQAVKFHRWQDGRLKEGDSVEVKVTRDRVVQLSAAKNLDEKNEQWDFEKGGPEFNKLWELYKKQDAGEADKVTVNRLSVKEIQGRAGSFKSEAIRKALLSTVGEAAPDLLEMDSLITELTAKNRILAECVDAIKDEKIKEVASNVFRMKPKELREWLEAK